MYNPKPKGIKKPSPPPAPPTVTQSKNGEWVKAVPLSCPTKWEVIKEVLYLDVIRRIKNLSVQGERNV